MASSSLESTPETIPGARYRLTRTLHFDNIRSKFAERKVVLTENFYCQHDPVPTNFNFEIRFGKTDEEDVADEDSFQVFLRAVSRDTTVTSYRIELFDDRFKLLKDWKVEKPVVIKQMTGKGKNSLHKFDATSESASSWRLIIDFVYIASPEQSAVTPADRRNQPLTPDQPQLRLQGEYSQLLDSGNDSDVTFVVQGERIKAHRLVLTTRCKHFETLFNSVKISDIKPKAFK